jgi:hypothetical protein
MRDYQPDKSLITTIVERWRSETLRLHLPISEMTLHDACLLKNVGKSIIRASASHCQISFDNCHLNFRDAETREN